MPKITRIGWKWTQVIAMINRLTFLAHPVECIGRFQKTVVVFWVCPCWRSSLSVSSYTYACVDFVVFSCVFNCYPHYVYYHIARALYIQRVVKDRIWMLKIMWICRIMIIVIVMSATVVSWILLLADWHKLHSHWHEYEYGLFVPVKLVRVEHPSHSYKHLSCLFLSSIILGASDEGWSHCGQAFSKHLCRWLSEVVNPFRIWSTMWYCWSRVSLVCHAFLFREWCLA